MGITSNRKGGETGPRMPAVDLRGDLLCARCRYNLRGLSITGVCPECATPVRATILSQVDPSAHELRPISRRGLIAWGVVAWSASALLAALAVWWLRAGDLAPRSLGSAPVFVRFLVVVLVGLSGVGSLALVRPHEGIPAGTRRLAATGCALYVPLCWLLWRLHVVIDGANAAPYGPDVVAPAHRTVLHIAILAGLTGILLCLRPAARLLASRSFLMRTGRTDRQTMAAMLAVLGVIALGDVLVLVAGTGRSGASDLTRQIGQLVILVGSVLFTLGLVGVLVDCWRLRAIILEPPLSLRDLIAGRPSSPRHDDQHTRGDKREAAAP
jgi:hypothetical protein